MRKLIKSEKEIINEVKALFENYKDDAELLERIKLYLDNITGKELYTKLEIERMIDSELFDRFLDGKIKFAKNSPLYEIYPEYQNFSIKQYKKFVNSVSKTNRTFLNNFHAVLFLSQIYNLIDGSVEDLMEFIDQSEYFPELRKINPAFAKLQPFLFENKDVAEMIYYHLCRMVRETIVQLVIDDIIPLKTLLIYFNPKMNVKQNTERLYNLCRRKKPRSNIQQAITDNIELVRKGKFENPFMLYEQDWFD